LIFTPVSGGITLTLAALPTFDTDFFQNLHSALRELRDSTPMRRLPVFGGTVPSFFRYHDCLRLLRDSRLTSQGCHWRLLQGFSEDERQAMAFWDRVNGMWLTNIDGASHQRQRNLLMEAFRPEQIDRLRPRLEEIFQSILNTALQNGPTVEFITAIAYPFPAMVIGEVWASRFVVGRIAKVVRGNYRVHERANAGTRVEVTSSVPRHDDYVCGIEYRALAATRERCDYTTLAGTIRWRSNNPGRNAVTVRVIARGRSRDNAIPNRKWLIDSLAEPRKYAGDTSVG
jgi:cytochrome P450